MKHIIHIIAENAGLRAERDEWRRRAEEAEARVNESKPAREP